MLVQGNRGEAEVVYIPAEIALKDVKEGITSASGEKHAFKVIAAIEEKTVEGVEGNAS